MPIYEYRCRACGRTQEILRSFARADDAVACDCGAGASTRLPSLVARRGEGTGSASLPLASPSAGAGGCCGGGCCA